MTDLELLQDHVKTGSRESFDELVRRHIGWVYSAALRQVRNAEQAQDVAQAVFIVLMQKASRLSPKVHLTGWLFNVTRYASRSALRTERRRQFHERQAAGEKSMQIADEPEVDWSQMAGVLDDLVARLSKDERQAILLRFYEGKAHAEVATALGVSEEAARKRVTRAVDRLRGMFAGKGIHAGAAALAIALSANTVQAAPPALAISISSAAFWPGSAAAVPSLIAKGAISIMNWIKLKIAAACVTGAVIVGGGTAIVVAQANSRPAAVAPVDRAPQSLAAPSSRRAPATPADDNPNADVANVPSEDTRIPGNDQQRYFLIGARPNTPVPPTGFGLLIVLPGADGGADFNPFVRRIHKWAMPGRYLIAQLVAVPSADPQQITWPTRKEADKKQTFATEDFIAAVVKDVKSRHKIDDSRVFSFAWSSGGPAAYAASLAKDTPIKGSFIAMSVFVPQRLPPLDGAKGHRYFILHSPDDQVAKYFFTRMAKTQLTNNGATVEVLDYPGGHGWQGNVFRNILQGLEWLEKPAQ